MAAARKRAQTGPSRDWRARPPGRKGRAFASFLTSFLECSFQMKTVLALAACASLLALSTALAAKPSTRTQTSSEAQTSTVTAASPDRGTLFAPEAVSSDGSVTVEGQRIDYRAVAGTIVVHPRDWDDAATVEQPALKEDTAGKADKEQGDEN